MPHGVYTIETLTNGTTASTPGSDCLMVFDLVFAGFTASWDEEKRMNPEFA